MKSENPEILKLNANIEKITHVKLNEFRIITGLLQQLIKSF